MRIPEIRERLHELAAELGHPELADLAEELRRRRLRPARRPRGPELTQELQQAIRDYADAHPDLRLQDLAETFRIGQGRIQTILYGARE